MASSPLAVHPDAVALADVADDVAADAGEAVVELSVLLPPPQPARTRTSRVVAARSFMAGSLWLPV